MQCQESKNGQMISYGWIIKQKFNEMKLSSLKVSPAVAFPAAPPWIFKEFSISLSLLKEKRKNVMDRYRTVM